MGYPRTHKKKIFNMLGKTSVQLVGKGILACRYVRDISGWLLENFRLLRFINDDHFLGYTDSPGYFTFLYPLSNLSLDGGYFGHFQHK